MELVGISNEPYGIAIFVLVAAIVGLMAGMILGIEGKWKLGGSLIAVCIATIVALSALMEERFSYNIYYYNVYNVDVMQEELQNYEYYEYANNRLVIRDRR